MNEVLRLRGDITLCPVAAIVKDRKVLLGHRHYTQDKWKNISVWTFPGGRCDPEETIEQTLRREVAEETGIHNLIIERYLGEVPGAKEGDRVPLFLCVTSDEPQLLEPKKFSEWKWSPLDAFPDTFINSNAKELLLRSINPTL